MTEHRTIYPANPSSARSAREAIVCYARGCGFMGQALCDVELAAGEAVANAIEHGNRAAGSFGVAYRFRNGRLTIEVRDQGSGFLPTKGDGDSGPADREGSAGAFRGWGVYIMRSVMDKVSYLEGGRTVRLEKALPVPREDAEPAAGLG